ncbi:MAG: two-component sensor histidine kinase, partial [Bacteroidota bacterium]|nr:two-component sensor histidine kinase [Bacteroidota bacterium]
MFSKLSLRSRIFFGMITLVVIASVLIAGVTIYQYKEQGKDYHDDRLQRKEEQILKSIWYTLKETTYPVNTENLGLIFRDEIYKIANVENVNFNIYDLEGNLIKSSRPSFEADSIANCLDSNVLNYLRETGESRFVEEKRAAGDNYQATYTYINDLKFKP